jgi:SPP1 gp7 family putative phage head morphogenesis protein
MELATALFDGVADAWRVAAPRAFRFDRSNPRATEWAADHAGDLIGGISKTTREDIRDLVEASFDEQFDVAELAGRIADLLGDDARADVIARTESMKAANEGQRQLWEQAQDKGLLGKNAQQEWIVGDDEKLCPICQDMDGVQVGLDEDFNVDGEDIDGPPAHPNCRCTVALVP